MLDQDTKECFEAMGFDFDFRPSSYFDVEDPIKDLLINMKGEARRKWLKESLNEEGVIPPDFLMRENLERSERDLLGRIHPTLMGGEFLADREENEVEIARFVMDSTTQDVVSIRARNCGTNIYYFVVDEYETVFVCVRESSEVPLNFEEFIEFLGSVVIDEFDLRGIPAYCRGSFEISDYESAEDLEGWRNFFSADSEFYPQLSSYFQAESNSWVMRIVEKLGEKEF